MLIFVLIMGSVLLFVSFWRGRRARERRHRQCSRLRAWAASHDALDPVVQQWIARLSTDEIEVLYTLLNGYCASLQWQLDWLFAPQIKKAPELQAVLEESIRIYARMLLLSLQMELDVLAYQSYLEFEKRPAARKQRPLVNKLYAKIDRSALTPPPTRALHRLAHKKVTPKAQVAAIRKAFAEDPVKTMQFLKEILADDVLNTVTDVRREQGSLGLTLAPNSA
ncbi:MAG: hypothetical protein KDE19_14645 [Caldilineaceae bacterium]|nr:hypothetical protein [Caldilineaceae bacterium]